MKKKNTIVINKRFHTHREYAQWVLYEVTEGKNKDGEVTKREKSTYHGSLEQVCKYVIDKSLGDCENLNQIIELLKLSSLMLAKELENV